MAVPEAAQLRWILRKTFLLAFVFAVPAILPGQFGGGGQPRSTSVANQVPLSGRTGQSGSVAATETPVPGTTNSVNTINPAIQVQGPYSGSVMGNRPFGGSLSLRDAIERGLEYNLGAAGLNFAVRQARGQTKVARSALLPNLNGTVSENFQETNLRALGVRVPFLPAVVGPFNYIDLRAQLSQTVADLTALRNYRSAQETARANEFAAEDARDLVVLAVGGAYLQTTAAQARLEAAKAQLETALALLKQTTDRRGAGLVAQIDVNRSQVQARLQQQRLTSLQNDFAKQKINLARLTGLPVNENYTLSDNVPFAAAPALTLEDALKIAIDRRPDLKSAEAQLRAAERTRSAARAERLPSLSVTADYGAIGTNPGQAKGTYTVVGTLRVPIWQGGRAGGDIEQAEAAADQRRAELSDLRGRVEGDLRNAFLDLQAASSQVDVARENVNVSRQTLELTQQRYDAGITDSVEVTQAQESVAGAALDYINAVLAHNIAKLSLARAAGHAKEKLDQFLPLK